MLTSSSNWRLTSVGAWLTTATIWSSCSDVRVSRLAATSLMASATCSGSWVPVRASTIASEARSPSVWGIGASVVVVDPGAFKTLAPLTEDSVGIAVAGGGVVATGLRGTEFVVVGDVFETAKLVDGITEVVDDSRDVDDDCPNSTDEEDWITVVVVLCSVEVVESGKVVVDVVVVGSGCVVVVLDDVCKGCVVSGELDGTVVGCSLLVVVVSSHVVTVLLGSGSTVVVDISTIVDSTMVVVDEVVVSGSVDVVVVGSGSVVVVVLVVVVAPWVVGTTGETDVSRSY